MRHISYMVFGRLVYPVPPARRHALDGSSKIRLVRDDTRLPTRRQLIAGVVYLAAALVVVRQKTTRPNPPISTRGTPLEWEYADDVDFADEERELLDAVLSTACTELANWNLFVNEAKTDNVHIFLANTSETDDAGNMLRGNEKWWSSKTLRSLLCSTKDEQTRCILGNVTFRSFWKTWMRRPKIPLEKRMLVYSAMVVPVMLYLIQ